MYNTIAESLEVSIGFLHMLEHEGMVADLPQLHDGVHHCLGLVLALLATSCRLGLRVHKQDALRLHVAVNQTL